MQVLSFLPPQRYMVAALVTFTTILSLVVLYTQWSKFSSSQSLSSLKDHECLPRPNARVNSGSHRPIYILLHGPESKVDLPAPVPTYKGEVQDSSDTPMGSPPSKVPHIRHAFMMAGQRAEMVDAEFE